MKRHGHISANKLINNELAAHRKSSISNLIIFAILDISITVKSLIEEWLLDFFNVDIKKDHKGISELDFIKDLVKLRNQNKHPIPRGEKGSFYLLDQFYKDWNEIHYYTDGPIIFHPIVILKYTGVTKDGINTNEVSEMICTDLFGDIIKMLSEFFYDVKNIVNDFVKSVEAAKSASPKT